MRKLIFVFGVMLVALPMLPVFSHAESSYANAPEAKVYDTEDDYFACFRVYTSCGNGTAQYCSEWGESGIGLLDWVEYLEDGLC